MSVLYFTLWCQEGETQALRSRSQHDDRLLESTLVPTAPPSAVKRPVPTSHRASCLWDRNKSSKFRTSARKILNRAFILKPNQRKQLKLRTCRILAGISNGPNTTSHERRNDRLNENSCIFLGICSTLWNFSLHSRYLCSFLWLAGSPSNVIRMFWIMLECLRMRSYCS